MAFTSSPVAVTPGAGASIAAYSDGTNIFQRVAASPDPSQLVTYSASYKAQSAGTGATTNILTMAGSATKTVQVTRILMSGTAATAASYFDVLVNRQSTADSGGTAATAATIIKMDTADAVASAVAPLFYTAAPTAGTVTGLISATKVFFPLTGTPAPVTVTEIVGSTSRPAKPLTLRGVADVMAITLNAVTPANATSIDVTVEWTEF